MSLISYEGSPGLECLYGLAYIVASTKHRTHIAQYLNHLFLFKELQDSCAEIVEVRGQSSQIDGPWVSFEGVQDARR